MTQFQLWDNIHGQHKEKHLEVDMQLEMVLKDGGQPVEGRSTALGIVYDLTIIGQVTLRWNRLNGDIEVSRLVLFSIGNSENEEALITVAANGLVVRQPCTIFVGSVIDRENRIVLIFQKS